MGRYYRKWLLFPTPYEEAVMLATVVGSQLHCDARDGFRLFVNTALVDIDSITYVQCQLNQDLIACGLVSAQPSVCQYQFEGSVESAQCQMALLYFTKQQEVPGTQLCEPLLT